VEILIEHKNIVQLHSLCVITTFAVQCYFRCCFSVSVKVLDHKFFSVTIKFQLFYFSLYFSYYCDFSVPVSVVYARNPMFGRKAKSII